MPYKLKSPCSDPSCPNLKPCPIHTRRRDDRPSPSKRGYDKAWTKLRDQVVREQPYCSCGHLTKYIHHLRSIKEYPELRLNRANLIGVCASCHQKWHNN